ncbi:MAG: helicase-exonuclease AddAB subunit AddA [Lachnospiraceae bacterium]
MMGVCFTEDQLKVITLRDRNILVSAAAGSGKTTVLVERIIQLISDEKHPVDIDRLLVVTFTNAAAASMREKISDAIAAKLSEQPQNEHLQKQATLLHNALITTIHSFCLFLIRNNFNDIGLDPGFRVADEGEIKLLQETVMQDLLEELFAKQDAAFLKMADRFITGNTMNGLTQILFSLYKHAMSDPFPEEWLKRRLGDYHAETEEELQETEWMHFLDTFTKRNIEECMKTTKENIKICEQPDGPYMYLTALEQDIALLEKAQVCSSFSQYCAFFEALSFAKLATKKDTSVDPLKRETVKAARDNMKDVMQDLRKKYYSSSCASVLAGMAENEEIVRTLSETVMEFLKRFQAAKRDKKLIDFSDMEHLALQILLVKEDGRYVPSRTALDYRSYFKEIMVDEYQDSNLVQEWILKTVSGEDDGCFNRFMVGDVKQSIYKFRLACPQIFMEKYDTYQKEESKTQRIDLSQNYRSRKEVIEGVNTLFYRLMDRELGEVVYDKECALYPGAQFPQEEAGEPSQYLPEILLIEKDDSKRSKQEQEAEAIAGRIREMIQTLQVRNEEDGTMRKASYRDIVILLRNNSGWDEVFKKVLEQEGIPVCIATKTGYFSTNEIRTVMNFLRVVDNPRQDIPLFGTMKSCFGKFSDEETAYIRAVGGENLYEALQLYAKRKTQDAKETELSLKCQRFLSFLQKYRNMVSYEPIHKILRKLFLETGYLYEIAALPGGEQRLANVNMLLEKAENFEKTTYSGLFYFIRYMEQIQKYDVDYGEAGILDENADVVRIMSIHKSKGLEFPICFVAGLSKKFNMNDARESVICDTDYGIAMDYVNLEKRVKYSDLRKKVIAEKIRRDNLSEELRVLYVALTRAKEKLVLCGLTENIEKLLGKFKQEMPETEENKKVLPLSARLSAASYMEWIMAALYGENSSAQQEPCFIVRSVLPEETVNQQIDTKIAEDRKKEKLRVQMENWEKPDEELVKQLHFRYAHENLQNLYTKTTVSELKSAAMAGHFEQAKTEQGTCLLFPQEEMTPCIPKFASSESKVSGSARGSAYHRIMEVLDYEAALDATEKEKWVTENLFHLENSGRITSEEADMINPKKVALFLEQPLAMQMAAAQKQGELYREQPFVLGVEAKRLSQDFPEGETVLVQGIIDVYFIENNTITLLDYKTDVVKTGEELKKRYAAQLYYYAEALERITGLTVKEKLIYSFTLGCVISL